MTESESRVRHAGVPRSPDTLSPVPHELFRSVMGSFPTGVTVVTTDEGGEPRGMTVNAFMSVSADPPILAVCVAKSSSTLPALKRTGAFAVHVLNQDSAELSRRFASQGSRFEGLDWSRSPRLGLPLLTHCAIAIAECLVERIIEAGDHELILGRVVGGRHTPDEPLVYHRRRYGRWAAAPSLPSS